MNEPKSDVDNEKAISEAAEAVAEGLRGLDEFIKALKVSGEQIKAIFAPEQE